MENQHHVKKTHWKFVKSTLITRKMAAFRVKRKEMKTKKRIKNNTVVLEVFVFVFVGLSDDIN